MRSFANSIGKPEQGCINEDAVIAREISLQFQTEQEAEGCLPNDGLSIC